MTSYAKIGSPFNFLGHMSLAQKEAFYTWINERKANFAAIQEFHQIRAQQLRKTAGLLENFYASKSLKPSFDKQPWQPGDQGYFPYVQKDDQLPAVTVQRIKERYKEQLQSDDESVFWMNWLRNHIERQEDLAQFANEGESVVGELQGELDTLFDNPSYDAVLVKDTTKFRVHQLDDPTTWEKQQFSHSDTISLKMPDSGV